MDGNEITGIVAAVGTVLAFVGMMVARWSETNPNKPWYIRIARVFDPTQVVDSTRKLGDE